MPPLAAVIISLQQAHFCSCALDPMIIAAEGRVPGGVDQRGALSTEPVQEHRRAQPVACRTGANQDELDQEPGGFAARSSKPQRPNPESPPEPVREVRRSTQERAHRLPDGYERLPGGAAQRIPLRPSCRSPPTVPPLEPRERDRSLRLMRPPHGVVAGKATPRAETERPRERGPTTAGIPAKDPQIPSPRAPLPILT